MDANSTILPGFRDPVAQSQRIFRGVLDAMAAPGEVIDLDEILEAPAPLSPATTAVLLTLADFDTPLWLDPAADTQGVREHLKFHCGTPFVETPDQAAFAVIANPFDMPAPERFNIGTDDYPDRSTTLLIQVEGMENRAGLKLSGPGIDGHTDIDITGLPLEWLRQRQALAALFPLGLDLILTARAAISAFPRSTNIEMPSCMSQ